MPFTTIRLTTITPKRHFVMPESRINANLRISMERYLRRVRNRLLSDYDEVPEGVDYRDPETGRLNRAYKRSGRTGRSWKIEIDANGQNGLLYSDPSISPWAVYVQGPRRVRGRSNARQTLRNKHAGWSSITDVAAETKKEFETLMNRSIVGTTIEVNR